jgi:ribosomal protein S12 methylthiotransferase accessory factor
MEMVVTFPGGLKVNANYKGYTTQTDQPVTAGGDGSAPAPFDLFLASIGTCAGLYVLRFCQERNIPSDNARIVLTTERNDKTKMIEKINIDIKLPDGFPEKYMKAVVSAANKCPVKNHILNPPEFAINASIG